MPKKMQDRYIPALFFCQILPYLEHTDRAVTRQKRRLKVTLDLFGCPLVSSGKKNSYARHFKGKHRKLYIVGKVNKCRFRKNKLKCLLFFLILQKKIAKMTAKMTMRHLFRQMN